MPTFVIGLLLKLPIRILTQKIAVRPEHVPLTISTTVARSLPCLSSGFRRYDHDQYLSLFL